MIRKLRNMQESGARDRLRRLGILLFAVFVLAFWGVVIYVIAHFVIKFW